ncbi:hypothetical protein AVEN_15116-1 [Araneus ventricosus]|uniref:Zinc finger CW-type PWWP domain protein 1 n=1 Tax=Araneus ventricosus TaxID=182803 RepID=A0A4Y2PRX0_ARAVE|nr:hypothetical protein AVEN_15116-1 [Araneus ventricosus]
MPSRKRRSNEEETTTGHGFDPLKSWNEYYSRYVPRGMSVECEKCNKWRVVKEYQEMCEVPEYFECSMWSLSDEEKGNCYIPQLEDDSEFTNELYTPGSLVWAKMKGHPRWPAMVEDDPIQLLYCKNLDTDPRYHVVFFGKKVTRTWLADRNLEPFSIPPSVCIPQYLVYI